MKVCVVGAVVVRGHDRSPSDANMARYVGIVALVGHSGIVTTASTVHIMAGTPHVGTVGCVPMAPTLMTILDLNAV